MLNHDAGNQPQAASSVVVAGRYRLLRRIGSGGMGTVWLARDEVLGRQVAAKEVHFDWGSSEQTMAQGRERSMREAQAAAALHHPNIVTVFDALDGDDGGLWIVMELVAGRSLKDVVLQDGPLPVDRVRHIGLQLLSALRAAHAAGITHRDVKPANVLVSDGDVVRLTDFGLARIEGAETLTESGAMMGTPGYLAPEQASGLTPGPPADLFGAGATLYFALEGVGPFHRDGYLPMLAAYARHDIRPPRRAGPLASLLLGLLAADPARRPTAEQAADMLQGAPARGPRVSRRVLLTGGAAITAAAGGVGFWLEQRQRVAVPQPRATALPTVAESSVPAAPVPSSSAPPQAGLDVPAWQANDLKEPVLAGPLLVGVQAVGVKAVDGDTGQLRWQYRDRHASKVFNVGNGLLLVYRMEAEESRLHAELRDAASGALRTTIALDSYPDGMADGRLFAEGQTEFEAYDLPSGRKRWGVPLGTRWYASAVPWDRDVICVATGETGETADLPVGVSAFNVKTGKVLWKAALGRGNFHQDIWTDGNLVYAAVTSQGLKLYALDPRTGARRWVAVIDKDVQAAVNPTINVTNVVSVDGGVVVAISDEELELRTAGLVAVRAGTVLWRRQLLNPAVATTPDGRLFAAGFDSVLYEFDPATGKKLWSTDTVGPTTSLMVSRTKLLATIGKRVVAYRWQRS